MRAAGKKTETDDVGAYIAAQPAPVRAILTKIRQLARKAAPKATEKISYRMPALFQDGALIYFAAFKNHIGIYPPVRTGDAAFRKRLAKYAGPKGNLRFPLDAPIPYPLIARIVRLRLKENGARKR